MRYLLSFLVVVIISEGKQANDDKVSEVVSEIGIEYAYPHWSSDAKKILVQSNKTGKWQLYISDEDGKNIRRITNDNYNNNFPDWSPDNEKIVFVSDRDGNEDVFIMNVDGSKLKNLTENSARDIHPYFAPDGKSILFNSSRDDELSFEVYQINIDGSGLKRLTNTETVETCARFSPDGKRIVYLLGTFDGEDIGIMNSDGTDQKNITISLHPEGWPGWTPDGKILFSSALPGNFSLYLMNPDGSNLKRITHPEKPFVDARANLSSDGKKIIFNRQKKGTIGIYKTTIK